MKGLTVLLGLAMAAPTMSLATEKPASSSQCDELVIELRTPQKDPKLREAIHNDALQLGCISPKPDPKFKGRSNGAKNESDTFVSGRSSR